MEPCLSRTFFLLISILIRRPPISKFNPRSLVIHPIWMVYLTVPSNYQIIHFLHKDLPQAEYTNLNSLEKRHFRWSESKKLISSLTTTWSKSTKLKAGLRCLTKWGLSINNRSGTELKNCFNWIQAMPLLLTTKVQDHKVLLMEGSSLVLTARQETSWDVPQLQLVQGESSLKMETR